jgi:hypothetical protein
MVLLEKEKLATIATTLQKQPATHKCLNSKLPTQKNQPTEKKRLTELLPLHFPASILNPNYTLGLVSKS